MNTKILLIALLAGILLLGFFYYRRAPSSIDVNLSVVASFYPLFEFANKVGGNRASVISIVPPGVEPHEFEPTSQDLVAIYRAKLFIYNGNSIDGWAQKIEKDLLQKGVTVVNMGSNIGQSMTDPHFWLDPVLAQKEVEVIRDTLIKIDPNHKDDYLKNSEAYLKDLIELDRIYREGLSSCELKEVITSHDAFAYQAKRYGFTTIPIAGITSEEEPSPKRMGEIAGLAKNKGIKHIFFETLVSPKLSETIAREIGAQTLVFNPLEGLTDEEEREGKNYLSLMRENLKNLKTALICQ